MMARIYMRRLPPEVAAKLAKRRGTAAQRQLALAMQAPLALDPRKLAIARQLVLDNDERRKRRQRIAQQRKD